jgi:LysM repeat protein
MTSSFVTNRIKLPLILGCVGITLLSGCVQMQMPDPKVDKTVLWKDKPFIFPPSSSPATCYRVKQGDNLYQIAKSHGYDDYKQLADWNRLQVTRWDGQKPVYELYPGQVLRVTPANVTCY